ncbi:thiamine pyrophosphate-binding protein [Robertmurraya yapensis]|uniref:Thiamine pyrophosphate-binding protein n=1 Tax=Bacillus yapensis TaxID=2492960 RepID=A0A431WI89_9BACI|nr:thiamine pyrophosphate-binding protein [Bacillus yapensis]RTR35171.1 thiamine pyrophosphate-binding protein [Bacillus yapensis]TKS97680.1 thiamine pyrophosphate-binding protein [Bacillus yapensis]
MKLGEAIVHKLRASGVETVFGIPGGGTSSDLLCNMNDHGLDFILTQHETTAAIMASIVGEIREIPGVCVADLGPGALSLAPGLAYAQLDRAPLITLTDRYGSENVEYALRQKIPHVDCFKPITKLSTSLSATNWNSMLNRGFKVALTPNYGPVHFDVPNDIVKKEVEDEIQPSGACRYEVLPDEKCVKKAVKVIEQAKYPIIIAGLGINFGSNKQFSLLESMVTKWNIPIFKTGKAKGAVSDDHELSLGLFMGGKLESPILEKSDLIIAIGLDPVELLPKKWPYTHSIISISDAPNNEEMYFAEVEVVGNLETGLKAVYESITESNSNWSIDEITIYKESVKAKLDIIVKGLSANRVVEIAQEVLPADTLMTTDVGASKLIVTQLWNSTLPRSFFMSNGLATMGFALPAAMALQHLFPNKVVASLTGDGGFMMRLPDIATAVQNKWPVISIIFSDQRLSLMDVKQKSKGYEKTAGNGFRAPDYVTFAKSFGANGWTADTEDELRSAIQEALQSTNQMPSIIEAKIDASSYHAQFEAIREL